MNLYLGVDGGGTKTKIVIINDAGKILFSQSGGPSSIDTVSLKETIEVIQNIVSDFNQTRTFKSAFIGLGGIATNNDRNTVLKELKKLPFFDNNSKITVDSDMVNALASGDSFNEGIVLISGTGMVCYGNNNGKSHKCGGWGYQSLDEGSAYYLGLMALIYTVKGYDKRLKITPFLEAVYERLSLNNINEFADVFKTYSRTKIASLAPLVTKFENDPYAQDIIEKATEELKECVLTVYKEIKLTKPRLVIVGSLGNSKSLFNKKLIEKILSIDENFVITKPRKDPALAAALLAKDVFN
ncbi:MAG: hypothetical protein M0O98_04340 [Acholeplasmataceae bacterium]|nr:hypothetical protein [Acholeplasmataceae bacterium]